MFSLQILNSKQTKEIKSIIEQQWDSKEQLDCAFLMNNRDRIFAVNREIGKLDFLKLRINSIGLYFGELKDGQLRLSIEGSQIIGPSAKKNVAEISTQEMKVWLKGEDLVKECEGCTGFVIVRSGNDFLGCGRYSNGTIKNFVPKTRRIKE